MISEDEPRDYTMDSYTYFVYAKVNGNISARVELASPMLIPSRFSSA